MDTQTLGQPMGTVAPNIDVFNLYRVNQTDNGDNSEDAKKLAVRCEEIKRKAAELLALYNAPLDLKGIQPGVLHGEAARRRAVAKTELETSVMWAVKSLFVNFVH